MIPIFTKKMFSIRIDSEINGKGGMHTSTVHENKSTQYLINEYMQQNKKDDYSEYNSNLFTRNHLAQSIVCHLPGIGEYEDNKI